MKCKECREKIPDNVKYCPECGALVNEKAEYNYGYGNRNTSNYSPERQPLTPPVSQRPYTPVSHSGGRNKRKQFFPFAPLVVAVMIILIFLFVTVNIVSDFNSFDMEEAVPEYFDGFNITDDVNNVALNYVDNIVDSDCMQLTDDFLMHSLIDWELVFKDYFSENTEYESMYQEIPDDENDYTFAESIFQHGYDVINSRFTEDFVPYYFYTEIQECSLLSQSENQFYDDMISEYFERLGLDVNDYYDSVQIPNMYRARIYVTAENEDCDEIQDFGMIEVILAEFYDEYYVLYDDTYIQAILDSIA